MSDEMRPKLNLDGISTGQAVACLPVMARENPFLGTFSIMHV